MNLKTNPFSFLFFAVLLSLPFSKLLAQGESSPSITERFQNEASDFRGWDRSWRLDFQGLLVNNRKVVGQTPGTSITLGGSSVARLEWLQDRHEWTNALNFALQYTRDPSLETFIKSLDELSFESFYLYRFPSIDWVGPYASFHFDTSVLKSKDVQTETSDYVVSERDGGQSTATGKSLKLTRAFAPLSLKESVGAYFRPRQRDVFSPQLLVGVSARETYAKGQRALNDDDATAEIEVIELRNIYQLGSEIKASAKGVLDQERFEYGASASILTPWLNNKASGDDRSALKLSLIEMKTKFSYHFADWIKASYSFLALKDPQLISGFQLSHDLKLTIGLDILSSKRKKK